MATVFDVADYFLAKTEVEAEERMTHLKVQKLVFYAQGFSLAIMDKPLFSNPIEAWKHGPVSPDLYKKYRDSGSNPIDVVPADEEEAAGAMRQAAKPFTAEQADLLDDVYNTFGQFSAWRLRELSHETTCWQDAYPDGTITHAAMKAFFETQIASD